MSNWFENNAAKSVVLHTIVVATAVWATFVFVFDENKINFYEAKVERTEAEAKEVKARNAVLASRVEYLTHDNNKLNNWLSSTPKSIPHYENQIKKLEEQLEEMEAKLASKDLSVPLMDKEPISLYSNFKKGTASTTFLDAKTNTVFGIPKINYGNTANINLTLPNGKKITDNNVKAGETWRFEDKGKEYLLVLDSLDWASQTYQSRIIELEQGEK
ncbi:hypothetical protein [Pseudoalteromonas rubra]|uniref:hypothetical protein n=1 Tax=Pseudoalteromonas rubra TaxID=43658 RepID=UPI002DBFA58B|nr:hypothetical protein [Pseudoalteromonas rubra]MEC4091914.1 hypothetical protein [Pseudoalteromonas rubra]